METVQNTTSDIGNVYLYPTYRLNSTLFKEDISRDPIVY